MIYDRTNISKEAVFTARSIARINVRDGKIIEKIISLSDLSQSVNIALHALCQFCCPAHDSPTLVLIHYRSVLSEFYIGERSYSMSDNFSLCFIIEKNNLLNEKSNRYL